LRFFGVSPCFLSKNAQKLPGYIERAAIPAYESSSKGIAFGMVERAVPEA
jgi:hypothetical protein